jgi:hypothetical protein
MEKEIVKINVKNNKFVFDINEIKGFVKLDCDIFEASFAETLKTILEKVYILGYGDGLKNKNNE